MLNVFTLENGRLSGRVFEDEKHRPETQGRTPPVWIDMQSPTAEEKGWVAERFGLTLPEDIVDDDLEESARFYEEDNGELHIRSDFLIDDDVTARNVRVAFILWRDMLFSVHDEDLPVFRLLRLRARRIPALIEDAKDVLLKLYDGDAEYSADALEGIYDNLERVSASVPKHEVDDRTASEALSAIAKEEDLNGRIRRNVMDTRRAVGFININQNKIIKIVSVASVALLPPTLIASIYGMNFGTMPELRWEYGYPFALVVMIASVAAPFIYFRRKGWLR